MWRTTQVLLDPPAEQLLNRLQHRPGHFMPAALLQSQLDALERPAARDFYSILDPHRYRYWSPGLPDSCGELFMCRTSAF